MYATDRRQTDRQKSDVRQHHRLMPLGREHNKMLITQVSLVHQTCTMSDVSNSFFFRGIAHGIIQRFINLLLERLHLIPEIELSEYSGIVKKTTRLHFGVEYPRVRQL